MPLSPALAAVEMHEESVFRKEVTPLPVSSVWEPVDRLLHEESGGVGDSSSSKEWVGKTPSYEQCFQGF
jgi:hypothetical protein